MLTAYKFRLYPDKKQKELFSRECFQGSRKAAKTGIYEKAQAFNRRWKS